MCWGLSPVLPFYPFYPLANKEFARMEVVCCWAPLVFIWFVLSPSGLNNVLGKIHLGPSLMPALIPNSPMLVTVFGQSSSKLQHAQANILADSDSDYIEVQTDSVVDPYSVFYIFLHRYPFLTLSTFQPYMFFYVWSWRPQS